METPKFNEFDNDELMTTTIPVTLVQDREYDSMTNSINSMDVLEMHPDDKNNLAAALHVSRFPNLHKPERYEGESQEEYKARRSRSNSYVKVLRRGVTVWNSSVEKTYRKDGIRNNKMNDFVFNTEAIE